MNFIEQMTNCIWLSGTFARTCKMQHDCVHIQYRPDFCEMHAVTSKWDQDVSVSKIDII